ncbi:MAG: lysylphosphatidylglycerol synthase domain-containing protein [Gammaproteobacteria bacterium]
MKLKIWIAIVFGSCLLAVLINSVGTSGVWNAINRAGWQTLMCMALIHLPSLLGCAAAWRAAFSVDNHPLMPFLLARWIRDGVNNVVPVLPMTGEMAGVRVLALNLVTTSTAVASTIVDVTTETVSQIGFALLGIVILWSNVGMSAAVRWACLGIGGGAFAMLVFILLQTRFQTRWLAQIISYLRKQTGDRLIMSTQSTLTVLQQSYRRHRSLCRALSLHLLAWCIGALELKVGAAFMGQHLSIANAIALDSLVSALRSAAFIVPAGLGVQDGGLVLLAGLLSIGPQQALALALLRRAREWMVGLPALACWQLIETKHVGDVPRTLSTYAPTNASTSRPSLRSIEVEACEVQSS